MAEQDLNLVVLAPELENLTMMLFEKDCLNIHQLFFQSKILSLGLVRLSESKRPKHMTSAPLSSFLTS